MGKTLYGTQTEDQKIFMVFTTPNTISTSLIWLVDEIFNLKTARFGSRLANKLLAVLASYKLNSLCSLVPVLLQNYFLHSKNTK